MSDKPSAWRYQSITGEWAYGKSEPPVQFKGKYEPLYTHPKEWVGLTDEEIDALHMQIKVQLICKLVVGTFDTKDIYRAVEAKLKEKNNV